MIFYYDSIDSTNRLARELALQGYASGTVVQAGCQDSGKGQHGRSFASPPGGLYFTQLLEPDLQTEHLSLVTLAVGLACLEAIAGNFALALQIKWPNDIYLDGRKLAGILCENFFLSGQGKTKAKVLAGVGINVNSQLRDFPQELQKTVTTLYEWRREQTDLRSLLALLVQSIEAKVALLRHRQAKVLAQWQQYDYLRGRLLVYNSATGSVRGTGLGLAADGRYRFVDEQGVEYAVISGRFCPLAFE